MWVGPAPRYTWNTPTDHGLWDKPHQTPQHPSFPRHPTHPHPHPIIFIFKNKKKISPDNIFVLFFFF